MKFIVFIILLIAVSCTPASKKPVIIPPGTASTATMSAVLADLHIAEAAVKLRPMQLDSAHQRLAYLQEHIYKQHQITESDFKKSLAFYSQHTELIDSIYQEVMNSISKMQAEDSKEKNSGSGLKK